MHSSLASYYFYFYVLYEHIYCIYKDSILNTETTLLIIAKMIGTSWHTKQITVKTSRRLFFKAGKSMEDHHIDSSSKAEE